MYIGMLLFNLLQANAGFKLREILASIPSLERMTCASLELLKSESLD